MVLLFCFIQSDSEIETFSHEEDESISHDEDESNWSDHTNELVISSQSTNSSHYQSPLDIINDIDCQHVYSNIEEPNDDDYDDEDDDYDDEKYNFIDDVGSVISHSTSNPKTNPPVLETNLTLLEPIVAPAEDDIVDRYDIQCRDIKSKETIIRKEGDIFGEKLFKTQINAFEKHIRKGIYQSKLQMPSIHEHEKVCCHNNCKQTVSIEAIPMYRAMVWTEPSKSKREYFLSERIKRVIPGTGQHIIDVIGRNTYPCCIEAFCYIFGISRNYFYKVFIYFIIIIIIFFLSLFITLYSLKDEQFQCIKNKKLRKRKVPFSGFFMKSQSCMKFLLMNQRQLLG
jgi:hypothetical protein